jgi:hypothetical protein
VVVSIDVRFEEDKAFAISLELSQGVEDDVELSVVVSKGAQPQWLGTPVSGVTGSPMLLGKIPYEVAN